MKNNQKKLTNEHFNLRKVREIKTGKREHPQKGAINGHSTRASSNTESITNN